MGTKPARPWGTPAFLREGAFGGRGVEGSEKLYVPRDRFQRLCDMLADTLRWQIFWKPGWIESGEFKVDFIGRVPHPSPLHPYGSKVMEIFGRVCNHVESVPELVSTGSRWRYGVFGLSAKKCTIQTLLLGPAPKCGCDPWLNPGTSSEVYESLCEWLELIEKGR